MMFVSQRLSLAWINVAMVDKYPDYSSMIAVAPLGRGSLRPVA